MLLIMTCYSLIFGKGMLISDTIFKHALFLLYPNSVDNPFAVSFLLFISTSA
mgnify:FL=1|jgi:hypothetical protein